MPDHILALPFSLDALEPHISHRTVDFHYHQHHMGYAKNLENLMKDRPYGDMTLEKIIETSHASGDWPVYNNAAQVWNHNFYWQSICPPQESQKPEKGSFFEALQRKGGAETVMEDLWKMALSQFGSGWAWLVASAQGELSLKKTSNADPVWLHTSDYPLLVVDVWEHAYYLDYQNRRAEHLSHFNALVHWSFAERRFNTLME